MWLFKKQINFDEPLDTSAYATRQVVNEGSPILYVYHELDGDWKFMGAEVFEEYTKIAKVVSLGEIIKLDKSVLNVANLPIGFHAERKSRKDKWVVYKTIYSENEMKEFGYYCATCEKYHREIPMSYNSNAPRQYYEIPEEEREKRCKLSDDQCVIDDNLYFIRGRIELSVEEEEDWFAWTAWVEVSYDDYARMCDMWLDENRILEKPYEGKLSTILKPYPDTFGLPVHVITQQVGIVPTIELLEIDHPLFYEQESGINKERLMEFARQILYEH